MRKYRRVLRWPIPSWLWKSVGTHCMGFTIQTSWDRLASGGCQVTVQFVEVMPWICIRDYATKKKQWFRTHEEMPLLTKLRLWWFWINSEEVKETDDVQHGSEEKDSGRGAEDSQGDSAP